MVTIYCYDDRAGTPYTGLRPDAPLKLTYRDREWAYVHERTIDGMHMAVYRPDFTGGFPILLDDYPIVPDTGTAKEVEAFLKCVTV